jgi:hypothetical protein
MPLFTAIDAVSPAISRWQRLLFRDFHIGLLLKLSFVALLAELSGGGGGSGSRGFGNAGNLGGHGGHIGDWHPQSPVFSSAILAAIIVFGILAFIVGMVIFYLSCRMKFVEFHIAATEDKLVGPAWRRYGPQTWKLFWVTIAIGLLGLIALAVVTVPIVLSLMHRGGDWAQPSGNTILGLILALLPIVFAWMLIMALVMMVIRDFMLPVWALEGATTGQAWQRAREIIERAPGDFAKYALVKAVLRLAVGIAGGLAWFLSVVISAVPVVAVGAAVYFALRNSGSGATAGMIFLAIAAAAVFLVWGALLFIVFLGAPLLGLQCYAVEWLGGRYPLLGNLLWPPPPDYSPVVPAIAPPLPA